MMIDELNNLGLKINENDFEQYKNKIIGQSKLRNYKIKNMDKYTKNKNLFSLPVSVHLKKLGKRGSMNIWVVDGAKVRHHIDIDFTTGGHGMRYLYVPLNEIWIDSAMASPDEIEPVIQHEITEFNLMKSGLNYDRAHDIACIVETMLRDNIAKKNSK